MTIRKTIAILITVYNRKEKTLNCIRSIYEQNGLEDYCVDIFIVDGGSTDGTPDAIKSQFPEVHVSIHDGLYWNRGMYTAWEEAAKSNNYDFYLWLNDDTFLIDECIAEMLKNSLEYEERAIIVASIRSRFEKRSTYGGHSLFNHSVITPNGELQECATMNGNCVLVPLAVYKVCGNLDWTFRHAIGDLDYGYRARKAGFRIYTTKKWLGYCESNPHLPLWARKSVPLMKRWRNLYSPLGYAEPIPFFHYEKRNFGLRVAIMHFISIHIRVLFPGLWKIHN